MNSDVQSIITRNDPARWSRPLVHRTKAQLPFDPSQVPAGAFLLFDATVYIDQLKGQLPTSIVNLLASQTILHGAPALGELAVTIGVLDPADRRTYATLLPIIETLVRINPTRIIAPSYEVWLEAAVIAGILARTQAILKQDRRKFLNDVLLFLQAAAVGAVMISRNSRDLDLLLQLKPQRPCFSTKNFEDRSRTGLSRVGRTEASRQGDPQRPLLLRPRHTFVLRMISGYISGMNYGAIPPCRTP